MPFLFLKCLAVPSPSPTSPLFGQWGCSYPVSVSQTPTACGWITFSFTSALFTATQVSQRVFNVKENSVAKSFNCGYFNNMSEVCEDLGLKWLGILHDLRRFPASILAESKMTLSLSLQIACKKLVKSDLLCARLRAKHCHYLLNPSK